MKGHLAIPGAVVKRELFPDLSNGRGRSRILCKLAAVIADYILIPRGTSYAAVITNRLSKNLPQSLRSDIGKVLAGFPIRKCLQRYQSRVFELTMSIL